MHLVEEAAGLLSHILSHASVNMLIQSILAKARINRMAVSNTCMFKKNQKNTRYERKSSLYPTGHYFFQYDLVVVEAPSWCK